MSWRGRADLRHLRLIKFLENAFGDTSRIPLPHFLQHVALLARSDHSRFGTPNKRCN
jgi:hypothetical protein